MQIVASVATYPELRDALGDRRLEHGLTQIELDYLSGVQDGWTGKAECSAKRWGQMSLACALGALGLRIVLVEDKGGIPRQTAEMAAMSRRRRHQARPAHDARRHYPGSRCPSARAGHPGSGLMAR